MFIVLHMKQKDIEVILRIFLKNAFSGGTEITVISENQSSFIY